MERFIIRGGKKIQGEVTVSGAKNVALKMLVAACLTDEEVIIHNVPLISDVYVMVEIIKELGGDVIVSDHTARIKIPTFKKHQITLDQASHIRTSSMFMAPLLARKKVAIIPNPGGCRLGARPIDRTVEGLMQMGAKIDYISDDGFFHATTDGLQGISYKFDKNTHTGTETLIIASVLARGTTVLENAAAEPEIDELIELLNSMGANVKRSAPRTIVIKGVKKLHGAECTILPDRNEIVTFAIAALMSEGDVLVRNAKDDGLAAFLKEVDSVGGGAEVRAEGMRFFYKGPLKPSDVETKPHPGFMTDWQAPWAVLMTKASGRSIIHETVFSNRFGYVKELRKMGAKIKLFNPYVQDPDSVYNFNHEDDETEYFHAVEITGPTTLHNGVVTISDLRAGASLVVAALAAKGETVIHGVHLINRGYEDFDGRLRSLGADIIRSKDD